MSTLYYEDLQEGEEILSPSRTVTEADIVAFAGLSGDYNALHTDEEFAKGTMFGGRVAHGLLGLSIASGLFTRTEHMQRMQKSIMAFMGLTWKFTGPIKIGDTIHVSVRLLEKKETKRPDRGVIVLERTVINQRGEVVQQGETTLMIARRPAS
ncbi:MAG: MaoC family dehydratase N-terminal domain-containing protein [Candidatus Tectomicrobia bacterium]|uniref:MaoC family dehydratase N-terminal domain-containing protein n=1 Tax=Tectimicrobiota bacterium TaxID=2528274 RepID=A0A932CNC1_UNCTE|nr:MaoC family dehydratase N-terminal domain-containing protein [Candidatus Tectomicrobia bacterium]